MCDPESEPFLLTPSFFGTRCLLQMVRHARNAGTASSTRHGTWVSTTWRPSGCCRLPLSCETSPSRRPTSSCWRPTERACASFCSVPTVTSSHSDSLDSTHWATWLPRLVNHHWWKASRFEFVWKTAFFFDAVVLGQFSDVLSEAWDVEDLFPNVG